MIHNMILWPYNDNKLDNILWFIEMMIYLTSFYYVNCDDKLSLMRWWQILWDMDARRDNEIIKYDNDDNNFWFKLW